MFFCDAVRDFLEEQEYKGNAPATLRYYRNIFDRFSKASGVKALGDFDERTIRRWLMNQRELSRNTLANYDRGLRVFANWLHHRGYVSENPMGKLPKPREVPTKIITFTQEDVRGMLALVKRRNKNALRDTAILTVLFDTGIRRGELASLTLQGINWGEGLLSVNGKTGERVVPFGRKSKAALRRYIDRERMAAHASVQSVFLTEEGLPFKADHITKHLCRIARAAGVEATKIGPHTFRHTFAVEFIKAGGDAFTLQQLLGHTTLDMTRKYVHLAKTDLRAAHRRFAPGDRML